jgi:signal transduction histidine kinase
MPSGAVWAGSARLGVWRRRAKGWEPLPGNATLAARTVQGLRPARHDGVWILGVPDPPRVREDTASRLGWEVLEALTAWRGASGAVDVLEDPDSTLWLTTGLGLARVPPAARRAPLPPVRVVMVEAALDGVPVRGAAPPALRHRHNRLDLRFAALSYRDPARIRYQVRLAPRQDWSDHAGPPAFRWIDLPAGRYRAEVRGSLDGQTWSPAPASFSVTVRAPWYLQPWAFALLAMALVVAGYGAHRARVTMLLRLERLRTQIALDLHDEMGSGLGTIGILSGVLAGERVDPSERARLTGKIGEIAGELGASLSDMVWALRRRAGTLQEVAARLAEHGARLCAGDTVRFEARLPEDWPEVALDFAASRAVLLIGMEALHNAARHAAASRITLAFSPAPGGWALVVEDDGRGLPLAAGSDRGGRGLGRESMRRRAEEIGGRIEWSTPPEGGTRVTLHVVARDAGRAAAGD